MQIYDFFILKGLEGVDFFLRYGIIFYNYRILWLTMVSIVTPSKIGHR